MECRGVAGGGGIGWVVCRQSRPRSSAKSTFQWPSSQGLPTSIRSEQSDPAFSPDDELRREPISNEKWATFDVWPMQTNGSSLTNLTAGRMGDARAPCDRILGRWSEVWSGGTQGSAGTKGKRLMLWPLIGGAPRNFLEESAAEVAWSPDGTRLVYHPWQAGDPTFVADQNGLQSTPDPAKRARITQPTYQVCIEGWAMDLYFAARPARHA